MALQAIADRRPAAATISTRRVPAALTILVALAALASSQPPPAVWAGESELIEFEIEDQFDVLHTDEEHVGAILVVVGSDKGGSEYNASWGQAIRDSVSGTAGADAIHFLRVADVRGVPFFLKGTVKGMFPEEREEWVLLDWKGTLAKAYEFEKDQSNVLVFDRDGRLAAQTHGTSLEAEKLTHIAGVLRELLTAAGGEPATAEPETAATETAESTESGKEQDR
jgi:hypothetical protein